jgi:hypothetical protein
VPPAAAPPFDGPLEPPVAKVVLSLSEVRAPPSADNVSPPLVAATPPVDEAPPTKGTVFAEPLDVGCPDAVSALILHPNVHVITSRQQPQGILGGRRRLRLLDMVAPLL